MSLVGAIDQLIVGQMRILSRDQDVQHPRLTLKVGDVLKGKVLKVLPDGRAIVSFKGTSVVVRPKVALSPKEEILARVQTLGSEIRLGLLSKHAKVEGEFLRTLAQAWRSNGSIGKLTDLLREAAAPLRAGGELRSSELSLIDRILALLGPQESPDPAAIAERLSSLAKMFGLMHEATIARAILLGTPFMLLKRQLQKTLKPSLKRLVNMLSSRLSGLTGREPAARVQIERLLNLCSSLYDNVEFQQLANHFLNQKGAQLYMQLPLFWQGESGVAELMVSSRKEDAKDGRINPDRCQVSLLIDLSGLGRVKAVAAINNRTASCLFATEKEAVKSLIVKHSAELVDGLTAVGFKTVRLRAMVSLNPLPRQLEAFGELFVTRGPAFDVKA
ncbi:MAG TPA: hypothetical protein VM163_06415 [bacterium]|nr:hypothetical protein [bacterium]